MSLTSHAVNFEDVLLWRALGHVADGRYLDVGAADPLAGSATQLFYQRGWHGVNLEPSHSHLRRLRIARPADINLPLAAAAAAGSAPFHEVPDTPLSTLDAGLAAQYRAAGHEVVLRQAALQTLDQVCAAHVDGPLHFVHIGTADPAAVLAGFDLERWQPWIVVLRAAAPALARAGYTLAYHDGWKHYYVSPRHGALAAALQLPPHPGDGFTLAEGHALSFPLDAWRARTAAAEAEAATSRTWALAHVEEWKHKYAQLEAQRERGDLLEGELARVRASAEELTRRGEHDRQHYLEQRQQLDQRLAAEQARAQQAEQQLPHLNARAAAADAAEAALAGIHASLSWRLTLPLREGKFLLRRAAGWLRRLPRRARAAVTGRVKRLLGATLVYINRRPKLSFFLRHQLARLPLLKPLARAVHARMVQHQASVPPAAQAAPAPAADTTPANLGQLPDAARRVFEDLRRSAPHS
ncbi:hypothetical protein LPN04_02520 [Rugamonas sp. A1-17]|nr:hypothetical protein [Rugamonas sp. A1-17]